MERIRNGGSIIYREYRRIIEWRSPLTGIYLMIANSAFWLGAMYGEQSHQEAFLATASACIFAWDVLLSPTNDKSIITHVLLWPFQSFFRTSSVCGSLYALRLMRTNMEREALYTALTTFSLLIINPVWQYHQINQKIVNAGQSTAQFTYSWFHYLIISPVICIYEYTKYIILFQWVPPLFQYFKNFIFNFRESCHNLYIGILNFLKINIVQRSQRCWAAFKRIVRYWVYGEWWPGLKLWMKLWVGEPLRYAFDYVCAVLVYIFCAHWFPPVWKFFLKLLRRFLAVCHQYIFIPIKIFIINQFNKLRLWLRRTLHRLAIAIRDSIIWPICLMMVELGKSLFGIVYSVVIQPVLNYLYGRYKILETVVLIHVLGPFLKVVINNIPDKNPLIDDSDVELEGLLPDDPTDSESEEEVVQEQHDGDISLPSSDSEDEFVRGLKFSAINGSESSDDEFDLAPSKTEVRKRKTKHREVNNSDDDFETLE